MSVNFASVDHYSVPRYLRSHRRGPVSIAEYQASAWDRHFDTIRRLFVCFRRVAFTFAGIGAGVLLIGHSHYDYRAAKEDLSGLGDLPERIELVDARGAFIAALPGSDTRRSISSLDELPQHLVDALLTMEDRRFFSHNGVNWNGVFRAAAHNAKTISLEHGGSGITQQLAKMWKFGLPKNETVWRKFDRKFLEWHLARRIESKYTKSEILCHYLNRIDFGGGLHGVYAASLGFFGKKPKDLNIEEAATLVAIIRGPGIYSPIEHPDRTLARRNLILRQLAKTHPGAISTVEVARVAARPLGVDLASWRKAQTPDPLSIFVQKELEKNIGAAVLAKGGLRVTLTLDSEWNGAVNEATERQLQSIEARRGRSEAPLQAAAVVIDNNSGAIRVMLGGRPAMGGQLNRATQSLRDPGSTIKPFIYCLLFERGANPDDFVNAEPLRPGELSFGPRSYSPLNSGGVGGTLTLREALEKSVNTAAIRVGDRIGFDNFANFLEQLGVAKESSIPHSPAAFLGAFGVHVLGLAAGYTIFPNDGVRCPDPHIVEKIEDRRGAVIFSFQATASRACSVTAARKTSDCLRGVMIRGTARNSAQLGLQQPAIGKTGTTDDVKDVWFAGSAADVTCVVWIGFDKPKHIIDAYAAQVALPLWVQIINSKGKRLDDHGRAMQRQSARARSPRK
jgi:penicillin-binding protein 1A